MRGITELVYHGWGTAARVPGTDGHGRATRHATVKTLRALGLPPRPRAGGTVSPVSLPAYRSGSRR